MICRDFAYIFYSFPLKTKAYTLNQNVDHDGVMWQNMLSLREEESIACQDVLVGQILYSV